MAERLKRIRNTILLQLKNIELYVDNINMQSPNIGEIDVQVDLLDETRQQFIEIQSKIEDKSPVVQEGAEDENAEQRCKFQATYVRLKGKLRSCLPRPGQTQTPVSNPRTPKVELPRITLPTFGGKYTDWQSYQDLFKALVHNNSNLSNVEKLQYLKTSLTGEPSNLLKSIETLEANYSKAWECLRKRYDNKQTTIRAHIKAIFNAPSVSSESHSALRKLLNTVTENVEALTVLDQPVKHWDAVLIYIISERLDPETRKQWELVASSIDDLPTFNQISEFLDQRCRALEASNFSVQNKSKPPSQGGKSTVTSHHSSTSSSKEKSEKCHMCKKDHKMYRCIEFQQLPIDDKIKFLDLHKDICRNCLNVHPIDKCNFGHCKKCPEKHHTSIHVDSLRENATVVTNLSNRDDGTEQHAQVLLATAMVHVQDHQDSRHVCRVLLDPGSHANFVTEKLVKRLRLKTMSDNTKILGIGAVSNTRSRGKVTFDIDSINNPFTTSVTAIILDKISSPLPFQPVDHALWQDIHKLQLADRYFDKPAEIDMLIGADLCAQLFKGDKISVPNGPFAFNTELGWVLMGSCDAEKTTSSHSVSVNLAISLDDQLQRFWQVENLPTKPCFTEEEIQCEQHYSSTHSRDLSGRYVVQLPFKENQIPDMGKSRNVAVQQFMKLEQRLANDPPLANQYRAFMKEYEEMGHMEITRFDPQVPTYVIPHFAVLREESTTTKLRVVFNASTKTDKGISLNTQLMVGATIQDNLTSIIMRFRRHRVALTADIEKMYRQIWVDPAHQNLQRIVWRASPNEPLKDYTLRTVTYGTASAPFLAIRTLHQLANDEADNYPTGAKILKTDFYVDDLLSGADSQSEAFIVQRELTQLLASGGFNLRKWSSNSREVLADQNQILLQELPQDPANPQISRTLGILWDSVNDTFRFQVRIHPRDKPTKRSILSDTAKLFDPLGWLSPSILIGKILMQKLWVSQVDWDDEVQEPLLTEWETLQKELPLLSQLQLPRFIFTSKDSTVEIHGFSDASETAYGAVVYSRIIHPDQSISVSLLCSKTRVAPVKQISLPKLELCGALLLAQLLQWTVNTLQLENYKVYAWTDSTVVLHWLSNLPRKWKTFVANRVAEIQEIVPPRQWRHVSTHENPADCCSRGLTPSQLITHRLWWTGPEWLRDATTDFQVNQAWSPPTEIHELREVQSPSFLIVTDDSDIHRYSSLTKLLRVTAYMLRFIHNCRTSLLQRKVGYLEPLELDAALVTRVRQVQAIHFSEEIQCLQDNNSMLPHKGQLKSLHPFVDGNNFLRVGGRLQQTTLPYEQKHPLILPSNNPLTTLIIRDAHIRHHHAECTLLLSILRQRFWILRARNAIRYIIHQCLPCVKAKSQLSKQLMGSLPTFRVQPARPFLRCGVDYAGPISTRAKTGRGRCVPTKSYIVVFVCFAVKAIHLEVASDMTTDGFMAAYRRFVGRRGIPADIHSDCGTNFVGANSELQKDLLASKLTTNGTKWHFNPPSAPHFGGLWEAGVKSTKTHLMRVIGSQILTYEELSTLLVSIEGCLNSRPLGPLSDNPESFDVLTPGHFLVGHPLTTVPSPDLTTTPVNRLSRWQMVERATQDFWRRWADEYVHNLQQRTKWTDTCKNLKCGELVLVHKEMAAPSHWLMGRVVDTHPGRDGLVRVVTLKTKLGLIKRPIAKVVKLPV